MEVTAVVEKSDFIQFLTDYSNGQLNENEPTASVSKAGGWFGYAIILVGVAAAFYSLFSERKPAVFGVELHLIIFSLLAFCLLVWFIVWVGTRQRWEKVAEGSPAVLGGHTYCLTAEAFEIRSRACDGRMFWWAVAGVIERPAHVYVMCGLAGGYIIPRRAFAFPEQAAEFVALARRYKAEAGAESTRG